MRKIISPCGFHCIKVNHLGVWFSEQEILKDVNLHMHCGSLNAIIGKNGAGKSTLIRAMLGDIPHTGDIEFRDTKDGRMQNLKIGYVPQSINIEKNTPVSVYDLLASYESRYPVFLPKNRKLYEKIKAHLRIFEDEDGKLNRSAVELGYSALVVSNFTLYGDTSRGKRPSFSHAAKGDLAVPCYEKFLDEMSHQGLKDVQHGEFGADMKIDLVNDGPVTIVIDTDEWKK